MTSFEGTDSPTKEDLKFIDKIEPAEYITVYGMHDYEFTQSWKKQGIPVDVFVVK
jgi:hypothetical protein